MSKLRIALVSSVATGGFLVIASRSGRGRGCGEPDALKFAKATGDVPENTNFAIKTGALRDLLDNSAVDHQTADTDGNEDRRHRAERQDFHLADLLLCG